jgi:hypothetical protein
MDRAQAVKRSVVLSAMLGTAALSCAGPPRVVPLPEPPGAFKPRQEIEVWRDSNAVTLHGVRVVADSLTGVPLWRPPDCDSCRVAMPLEAVDSIRTVNTEHAWMVAASLPFVALGVVAVTVWLNDGD